MRPDATSPIPEAEWFCANSLCFAIYDRFPVSPGHVLVITRRVVPTYFDCTAAEQAAVMEPKSMPLYEYSCEKCSRKIELLVRGDEKPECPHCKSTQFTKLLSAVSGHVANGGGDSGAGGGCGRPQCGMGGCAGLG